MQEEETKKLVFRKIIGIVPTEEEYKQRINDFDWERLEVLWQNIQNRTTPDWDSGKAFEYLILRSFELSGSEVVYPFGVNLFNETVEQIDGPNQ